MGRWYKLRVIYGIYSSVTELAWIPLSIKELVVSSRRRFHHLVRRAERFIVYSQRHLLPPRDGVIGKRAIVWPIVHWRFIPFFVYLLKNAAAVFR